MELRLTNMSMYCLYMYTFAGTAIAGLVCVDVHTMHVESTRSDRLPSHTTQSSYINLTFV